MPRRKKSELIPGLSALNALLGVGAPKRRRPRKPAKRKGTRKRTTKRRAPAKTKRRGPAKRRRRRGPTAAQLRAWYADRRNHAGGVPLPHPSELRKPRRKRKAATKRKPAKKRRGPTKPTRAQVRRYRANPKNHAGGVPLPTPWELTHNRNR